MVVEVLTTRLLDGTKIGAAARKTEEEDDGIVLFSCPPSDDIVVSNDNVVTVLLSCLYLSLFFYTLPGLRLSDVGISM